MKLFPKSVVAALSLLSFGGLVLPPALAQDPSPSPSPSPKPVAIFPVLTSRRRPALIASNVFISIENHRIKSIGNEAPAGAAVIDLSSALVMPGMVDCHAHILGNLADLSPGSNFRMSSAKKTLWGMQNLKAWLAKGF